MFCHAFATFRDERLKGETKMLSFITELPHRYAVLAERVPPLRQKAGSTGRLISDQD
jgi:hypothetical protein